MSKSIQIKLAGNWGKTKSFLYQNENIDDKIRPILINYAIRGVRALRAATPRDTGKTAFSWKYRIDGSDGIYKISWYNTNLTSDKIPVAILIQYGHATRNGGFVYGRDYINPAIQPIFDEMCENIWKEVAAK